MDKGEIHTHSEILSLKKDERLPFATTWMGLEGIMQRKTSQMGKNKDPMWNIKQTNKLTKQKQTHRDRQRNGGYQRGRWAGGGQWLNGAKYMVMNRNWTVGGDHSMECTDIES